MAHKNPITVLAVRQRWELHSSKGGYDPLFDHLARQPALSVSSIEHSLFCRTLIGYPRQALRAAKRLACGRLGELEGVVNEVKRRVWLGRKNPQVIHMGVVDVLVGEIKKIREAYPASILIGSIHLPTSAWECQPKDNWLALKQLDMLIVLCTKQKVFFEKELRGSRVVMVPHGVDTEFFRSAVGYDKRPAGPPRVIFVGTHRRDFQALQEVASKMLLRHSSVCFNIVLPVSERPAGIRELQIAYPQRVSLHDSISPETLLHLYQGATAAFVPVTDATANNTILEALACGLPVISTAIGGTGDYVTEGCGFLIPAGDIEAYCNKLTRVLADGNEWDNMRRAARQAAEGFAWGRIAERVATLYEDIVSLPTKRGGWAV